ncbi:MAG TPA: hypothetical protein VGH33_20205, partial [Isosphaeraceae bacterium]
MRGVDPSSYTVFLGLIVLVVAIGATVVYRLKRDVEEDDAPVTDEDIAREFERAYFSGEMDEAEYRRVTEALRARNAGVLRVQPPAAAPEPASEPPTEPAAEAAAEPSVETASP